MKWINLPKHLGYGLDCRTIFVVAMLRGRESVLSASDKPLEYMKKAIKTASR